MSARELAEQAELMLLTAEHRINELLGQQRTAEAEIALADAQRDLRDLKRALADEERDLRARLARERMKTDRTAHVLDTFASAKARALARASSAQQPSAAGDMAVTLRPYGVAKAFLDRGLASLELIKVQITQAPADERRTDSR